VEIRQWGRQKPAFRRSLLPVAQGIALHGRLNDVMNAFGGGLFSEAFATWVKGLRADESGFVTSDGKTPRRARGGGERHPLHVVLCQRPFQLTCARAREVIEVTVLGSLAKRFHAAQQASTMALQLSKTLMASELARRSCQMFSTRFSSGLQGGAGSAGRGCRERRGRSRHASPRRRGSARHGVRRGINHPADGFPDERCDVSRDFRHVGIHGFRADKGQHEAHCRTTRRADRAKK